LRKTGGSIREKKVWISLRNGKEDPGRPRWRKTTPGEKNSQEQGRRKKSPPEIQWTEEERIARAIKGEGEFLSEEFKKLLREVELARNLRAGALAEEIEARESRGP
jgi:hypothetical protein